MSVYSFNDDWTVREPQGPFHHVSDVAAPEQVVRLPHDAMRDAHRSPEAAGAGAYFPPVAVAYVKRFPVPEAWAERLVRLEVQGAFRRAQVFVNDELVGGRSDGYARFMVELTPFLQHGADNEVRIEVRTGSDSRWYSGAGLHRPVLLHVDELLHVVPDGVTVRTVRLEGRSAVVEVRTRIGNAEHVTRTVRLKTEIACPDGAVESDSTPVTVVPGETTEVRQLFHLDGVRPWSPDDPALHQARVRLGDGADETVAQFGIRVVTVHPRDGLRLNGKPVLLRGACVHHDNGPLGAAAIGRAEQRRVELLKAAGFNAIRAAHNPLSEAMLDACDRLGMLVMDEAFDYWTRFKTAYDGAADFTERWQADLDSMLTKDRNHPSVILYSLGNEIIEVGTPHGARWTRRLADHVRAADPTRPVTLGVNMLLAAMDTLPRLAASAGLNEGLAVDDVFRGASASEEATTRTEEACAALDVVGLNYGESRYGPDHERFPNRVLVGAETFPSEIGRLWPMVLAQPNVIGDFTWTGWDYLGEVGIGATAYAEVPGTVAQLEREYPFLTSWSGDLDITGWRRPASYYREIVFGRRSEPYLAVQRPEHAEHTITMQSPWAWSDSVSSWTWPGHEEDQVQVEVYAQAEVVALHLDGVEVARAEVGVTKPLLAELTTRYRPGTITAIAYTGGRETGRTALTTARDAVLTAALDRDAIHATDHDLAYLSIELRDIDGTLDTAAARAVTVRVAGAAELAGMCSANPSTTERFADPTWQTFDGRALAVLRPTSTGTARITVSSPELQDVVLDLQVVSASRDESPVA